MKNILAYSLLAVMILVLLVEPVQAGAERILNLGMIHAMVTNPVSMFGKTYDVKVDNKTYPIYYGFNTTYAVISNISLVPEHGSIRMSLKNVTETDAMWVYIPQSVISADGNNFLLYVDGHDTKYELAISSHSTILGFMVPASAHLVEIKGTHVIAEFPISACVISIGFVALVTLRFTAALKKLFFHQITN